MPTKTQTAVAQPAPEAAYGHRTVAQVVAGYLAAFYAGDFDAARPLVADGLSFRGPFLQVDDKDAFFQGAEGLRPIVRGHRMLRQWAEGEEVCSWYEVDLQTPVGRGSVLMSEWDIVRDGRLVAGRVVFDTAAFRALVPPQGAPAAASHSLSS